MIRRMLHAAALAATLLLAGCFGGDSPQEMLAAIEEMQGKNHPLTERQKTEVAAAVTEGKEAMAAGREQEARDAFARAIEVLEYAESAAIYNAAD